MSLARVNGLKRRAQTVQVTSTTPGAVTLFLEDDTGRMLAASTDDQGPVSLNLDRTADYTIFLTSPGAAPAITYSLTVTIP